MRHSSHLHLHFHTHHRAARYDVDMTKGSITKHLINFALPLMVGNLFQQLYNMVDTWVVGNYVSNEAFSAVGTVTPIINTLIGFFLGLSSGAGVVISQYYGAGREDKVRQAVHTSLVLTLLMGAVFTAAGIAMTPLMLRLMKTPAEVAPEQTTYLTIYFAGVMGLLLYNMGSGILRAVGDSRRPFYFLLVSAVLNTGLDLLFVLKFGMGVEGVAYATIIAQAVSAALTIWVLMRSRLYPRGAPRPAYDLVRPPSDRVRGYTRRPANGHHRFLQRVRPGLYQLFRPGLYVRLDGLYQGGPAGDPAGPVHRHGRHHLCGPEPGRGRHGPG